MVWTEHRAEAQGSGLDPSLSCRPPSSYHAVWAQEGSGKPQNPLPVTDQSVKVLGPSPARSLLGRKQGSSSFKLDSRDPLKQPGPGLSWAAVRCGSEMNRLFCPFPLGPGQAQV